jgi:hypothetical protein
MLRNKFIKISSVTCAGFLLAAVTLSLSAQSATAASEKYRRAAPIVHRTHHLYAIYRWPSFARPTTLPRDS